MIRERRRFYARDDVGRLFILIEWEECARDGAAGCERRAAPWVTTMTGLRAVPTVVPGVYFVPAVRLTLCACKPSALSAGERALGPPAG